MKFSAIAAVLICAVAASADFINVPSAISEFYPTGTPNMNGAQSTSIAKAFLSIQSSWRDSAAYTSADRAISSAVPTSLQASVSKSGYHYREITGQPWYTKNVPKAVQTAVAGELSAFDSAQAKILGTKTSKGEAARTAVPMAVGALGIMGGVLAAF